MARDPQLPGFDRARVGSRGSSGKARGNRGAGCKWRCHACGAIHRYWAQAERHADEQRHHRIEVVFNQKGEAA